MTKDKIIFSIGIVISLIVIGTSGWLFVQSTKTKLRIKSEELIIKTTQEPTVTQKSQETIDYKNTDIEVLNGSGKSGLAKVYADKLTKLGYTKITTGNYEKTEGNLLFAPTDFGKEINLENYEYEKSDTIKVVFGI